MCPVTPEITVNCKASEAGGKTQLNFTGSLLGLASERAQTPAANDAQPRLQSLLRTKLALRFWKDALGEGVSFFTAPHLHTQPTHTTYTNSVLKPARTFLRYASCSSPWFSFSRISVFCSWRGLAVEVLNNRSGSSPVADSDMRARARQILLLHSRFRYPKKFRCLSKLNFLRVNYPCC